MSHTRDLTFKFQTHIWPPLAPENVCFVSAFWWAAIVEPSRGCLIDFAWKINASLNSIFVFVWYLVNTGANPTRWQMLNWCSHMTLPGKKGEKKDVTQKLLLELEQKSFFFRERDQATFFSALVLPGASSEEWKKITQCATTVPRHKQERQAQQLSNIWHETLFAKTITEQDQILCLMACIPPVAEWLGDILGEGSKRLPACLSPGESQQWAVNKLLWPRLASSLPLPPKPAWHWPGSRWPVAAGLACSSVCHRAAIGIKKKGSGK